MPPECCANLRRRLFPLTTPFQGGFKAEFKLFSWRGAKEGRVKADQTASGFLPTSVSRDLAAAGSSSAVLRLGKTTFRLQPRNSFPPPPRLRFIRRRAPTFPGKPIKASALFW